MQLEVVQMHYPMVDASTRALLLSTYVKLANLFPEIKQGIQDILSQVRVLWKSLEFSIYAEIGETELDQRTQL